VVIPALSDPHVVPEFVLYIGPDQIMPLTSVFGALLGVALMFWNRLVGLAHKCWSIVSRRAELPPKNAD